MNGLVDGMPRGVSIPRGSFPTLGNLARSVRSMSWPDALTSSTIASSVCGMVAQAVDLPSQVTWSFVALSLIPCVTLLIRAVYSYQVRKIESKERLEMIKRGLVPPASRIEPIGHPEEPRKGKG